MKYVEFLERPEWKLVSEYCKKRDNYTCVICGNNQREDLIVHHTSYEIKEEFLGRLNVDQLETRCRSCHDQAHPRNGGSTTDHVTKDLENAVLAYLCILGNLGIYREYIDTHPDSAPSQYYFHTAVQKTMNQLLDKLGRDAHVYPRYIENAFNNDRADINARRRVIESRNNCSRSYTPEVKEILFQETSALVLKLRDAKKTS